MSIAKIERFPVHELSLDAIKVDHSIQSRVKMSVEDMREFSEAMLRGAKFPPITVFFDGKVYWLADGFHRHAAAKKAGANSILAEVRDGTKRDAIIFSAGANQKFSIPRKPEDLKKSVFILLEDEEWFGKSNVLISKHIGVSTSVVVRYTAEFCSERKVKKPEWVDSGDARKNPRFKSRTPVLHSEIKGKSTRYYTYDSGKLIHLGYDKVVAKERLVEIQKKPESKRFNIDLGCIVNLLSRHGLFMKSPGQPASVLGIFGLFGHDCVCTSSHLKTELVTHAVGRVLMLRKHLGRDNDRAVVICYPEDGPAAMIELARKLGVEFMSPEQLVENLKQNENGA